MKKVVSIVLVVLMLFSVFATVSAETNIIPNPLEMPLGMNVEAKEAGTNDALYSSGLSLTIGQNESRKGVDYRATLDMSGIRDLFSEDFVQDILGGSQSTIDKFNNGDVTTTINVQIDYLAAAITEVDLSSQTVGVLDAGNIFEETSRVAGDNSLTITYQNESGLKVSALNDSVDGPLKDIVFTLEDAIFYNTDGNHQVSVTLSGSTVIDFGTRQQTVNYSGSASNTVAVSHSYSSGVGVSSYTVKFNSNGGTEVKSKMVNYGAKITAPEIKREGYEFTGWYADADLTQLFDFDTAIKRNITLYAGWKKIDDGEGNGDGWFIDVDEDEWYYEPIKYVFDKGFMNGISDTYFDPNGSLTRAMFVTILYRIENEPGFVPSEFVDLEVESWYEDAVHWAYENGITLGVSDTEFAPDRIIIREQIVAMLYRYATFKGYDISAGENTNILSYEDALTISEYAVPAFQWAVGEGIMKGKSETTLNPKDNTTRAEASALMMRLYEKYNK